MTVDSDAREAAAFKIWVCETCKYVTASSPCAMRCIRCLNPSNSKPIEVVPAADRDRLAVEVEELRGERKQMMGWIAVLNKAIDAHRETLDQRALGSNSADRDVVDNELYNALYQLRSEGAPVDEIARLAGLLERAEARIAELEAHRRGSGS